MNSIDIFVGYDPREPVAYHVCCNSLIRQSSIPLRIHPLALNNLAGYTEKHKDGSNQFIYSRFLVPLLMDYKGLALYIDGDMVVRGDIADLFELHEWGKAVSVVKHDYKTKATDKYLGNKNQDYPRKNWSSVMLFDCGHFSNRYLTTKYIEKGDGETLHRFKWLKDDQIGELPIEWNWLPDEFGENPNARLLHWTLGTPCFTEYHDSPMADIWHSEHRLTNWSS